MFPDAVSTGFDFPSFDESLTTVLKDFPQNADRCGYMPNERLCSNRSSRFNQ